MPDSDPIHDNPRNTRNLPAVVQEGEVLRPTAENWLTRAIRTLFGWKPGSLRDDLQVVLDASTPDEVGFSAIERTMLRNILGLHERRIADVMIHRAERRGRLPRRDGARCAATIEFCRPTSVPRGQQRWI